MTHPTPPSAGGWEPRAEPQVATAGLDPSADPEVAAALRRLSEADGVSLAEQADVYDDVARRLQHALDEPRR